MGKYGTDPDGEDIVVPPAAPGTDPIVELRKREHMMVLKATELAGQAIVLLGRSEYSDALEALQAACSAVVSAADASAIAERYGPIMKELAAAAAMADAPNLSPRNPKDSN
jgi:hypothetical protein